MRSITGRLFPALVVLSFPAASIAAEQSSIASSVHAGERVRITKRGAGNPGPLIGIYRAGTPESLEVRQPDPDGDPEAHLSIPIDDVASIEVSRGRKRHTLAGVLVGFLAGGAMLAAAISSSEEIPPIGAFPLPVYGALMGSLVGSGIVSERWEKVWDRPAPP